MDGERIALETKKITRHKKFAEPIRRHMPGTLRRNEELFFRALGAGLCNGREDFVKGGEGAKAVHRNPERISRIKSMLSAGARPDSEGPTPSAISRITLVCGSVSVS